MTQTALRLTAALAALLLAGCGSEERSEPEAPARGDRDTGRDGRVPGGQLPGPAAVHRRLLAGRLGLAAERISRGRVPPAPRRRDRRRTRAPERRPGERAARSSRRSIEAPAGGGAGLLCRASEDYRTGYALLLYGRSRIQLVRLQDGDATTLKAHTLTPNERSDQGEPTLLRLGCGTGEPGRPVTLSYTVNATPYGFVADRKSIDPGDSARVGLVARDGAARFDDFALWLAE